MATFKYDYYHTKMKENAAGVQSAEVFFSICDTDSSGELANDLQQTIPFTPTFPIADQAAFKAQGIAEITAVYAGATQK